MKQITDREKNRIKMNYDAFVANYGYPRIEKGLNGEFFVFYPETDTDYVQYCRSIDYLDGWLYGCVQGALVIQHRMKKLKENAL